MQGHEERDFSVLERQQLPWAEIDSINVKAARIFKAIENDVIAFHDDDICKTVQKRR